jgi:hypothetical protein
MKLEKIITLASGSVRLRFLAMERSLRAVGCNLPLLVIPYNNDRFELPPNSTWWEMPEVLTWLDSNHCHKAYRKYQCLLTGNYQFVDTDVIFLRNPEVVLADQHGFITSCGHWRSPNQTFTFDSIKYIREHKTSLWEKFIFNTGQFACDSVLYDFNTLKKRCEDPVFAPTCLFFPHHEQPGINFLVNASNVRVHNITLPPEEMESTFAADYYETDGRPHEIDHEKLWSSNEAKKPYLIHWAGCRMYEGAKIDELFLQYLTRDEKKDWQLWVARAKKKNEKPFVQKQVQKLKKAARILLS